MAEEQKFNCEFCKKDFSRESGLLNHSCVKKQRWLEKDSKWSIIALSAYKRFYKLTSSSQKIITVTEFINSRYYVDFVKLGRYMSNQKIINPDGYVDYVIKNSVKIKEWDQDHTYERYIKEVINSESPNNGIERSIMYISEWTNTSGSNMDEFFEKCNTNIAVNAIRGGRISPWLIYLSNTSNKLLDRLDDSQLKLLKEHLNPALWQIKKNRYKVECNQIKNILKEYGL